MEVKVGEFWKYKKYEDPMFSTVAGLVKEINWQAGTALLFWDGWGFAWCELEYLEK